MGATFRLLDSSDANWDDLVARTPHDVYHLRGYARVCEAHEALPVRLAVVDDGREILVVPIIVRPVPEDLPGSEGLCDVTVPYGYPVPVCSSTDVAVARALVSGLLAGLRRLGVVAMFLRWHPLLGAPRSAFRPEAEFVTHGEHVLVGIGGVGDDPTFQFRENHRRNIRRLISDGYALRFDDAEDWVAFPEVYRATMVRAGASPFYLFPDGYFETMRRELGGHSRMVAVEAPDGALAAAAILFACGPIAQYHLSGTVGELLARSPLKLAFLGMMHLSAELGVEQLNLGSGIGGKRDSLFAFKAGFSRQRAPFESARVVLDGRHYRMMSSDSEAPDGFFPAYRHATDNPSRRRT